LPLARCGGPVEHVLVLTPAIIRATPMKRKPPITLTLRGLHDGRDPIEVWASSSWLNTTPEALQQMIGDGVYIIDDQRRDPPLPSRPQQRKADRPRCGALARSTGKPCKAPGKGRGGRCRRHGGASTGPRTEDGMARLKAAVRERWRKWRATRRVDPAPPAPDHVD